MIFRIFALGAFALLAACAGGENVSEPSSSSPSPAISSNEPEIASTPDPKEAVPEISAPAPQELIGLKPTDLSKTFGSASLVRRDLGAEIWQYRTRECVLFLFLYAIPEGETSAALRVRHIDVRGKQSPVECVKTVVRERGTSS